MWQAFRSIRIAALILFAWAILPAVAQADLRTITALDELDIKDWDPAILYSGEIRTLLNVYETLVQYDAATGTVKPMLATDWSVSDDKLTWTFHLRKGVRFHDGTGMNAAAVKGALDRTIKLGLGGSFNWGAVDQITAPDDDTVVIRTRAPSPIDLIASAQYASYIYSPASAEAGTDWFNAGNDGGTGPYRVVQWQRGEQVVLQKFDAYWGGWDGGEFDRAIVKIVQEASTQAQLLNSGEADIAFTLLPPSIVKSMQADPALKVDLFDSWVNMMMTVDTAKYPTDNLKFREALARLVDYAAISDVVFEGQASVPKSQVPQSIWGAADLPLPGYDVAAAKQLLAESGVPQGDWKVTIGGHTAIGKTVAELFQAVAAQAGVTVTINFGEWGQMWDLQKNPDTAANLYLLNFWPDYATPSTWLAMQYRTEDPVLFNFSRYANPDFDAAVNDGIAFEALDRDKAAERYRAAQAIVGRDVASIMLADQKRAIVHRADIEGVTYSPAYETVFLKQLRRRGP